MSYKSLDTQLVHAGYDRPRIGGAVVTPVFRSATFDFRGSDEGETLRYIRYNNTPNHDALHRKLATLERGEAAVVTASGMAAISTALLALLDRGDHLLIQDTLYGGTAALVAQDLPRLGIEVDAFDPRRPEELAARRRPQTRAIYTEALSNPLVQIPDHRAIVAFARRHGLISLVDATFATPVNWQPLTAGYDLAIHSCTKYLNGHSDIVAGAVIGRRRYLDLIAARLRHFGGSLDPGACFLLDRGLKTLALRVARQNDNAQRLAEYLESHPAVGTVHYPGLPSHPDHDRGRELFRGCGGVLAFEVASGDAAARLLDRLEVMTVAPSLGGVETLVSRPAVTSHAEMAAEDRRALGIGDGLVRVAVGIEDPEELIADLEQALA
ncbi:MAG: PLP-dependent transferase [Acidobacteria bacterium]|nr:MAG: PLP-dependent transferase [Acidobacteriota bacterium]